MRTMDCQEIMSIIPHRYPFLFVDSAEIVEPGKQIIGYKNLTINEGYFSGHFPAEPVMPGVIILEAIAQTGVVLILSTEQFSGAMIYLGGVNHTRFRKKVKPGERLKMEFELLSYYGNIGIGRGRAEVEGKVVCETELTFVISKG